MIDISNISHNKPYKIFQDYYEKALIKKQENIEAIVISSINSSDNIADSRVVNLKYISQEEWIFFSNYHSIKAKQFKENPKISALFFWSSCSIQIRIKAKIFKTGSIFSDEHFSKRSNTKNALAISSNQSKVIHSYDEVVSRHAEVLKNNDFSKRPDSWGGFSFKPYYFEFWEGNESRLNIRNAYEYTQGKWLHYVLEP